LITNILIFRIFLSAQVHVTELEWTFLKICTLQIPFYPPQQQFEEFTEEVCKGIIYDAAGTRDIEIEVKTIKKWSMHAQVAASYFDKYGRIILVGDAAHRFPPAGGFGLNTGVQDAHNLAWKLAAVLKGHCPSALLLTYDTERRPVCTETLI
jgi:2-polyprenyl-6-methoxyphenol hydroxylase-like FAD-dependent oxidoreductase